MLTIKPIKLDLVKEKDKLCNTVRESYNKRFKNHSDEYNKLSDVKKNKYNKKFKPKNWKLEDYDYDG